jgi:hypothetical protein
VIVNAMFEERSADKVADRLFAKALVLDDGAMRIAFCVVDSCMVPREIIDQAKEIAAHASGIPAGRMLVSATHTHSAPSAMGCLGSRLDPDYAAFLPQKIAAAIVAAAGKLQPARIAWTSADDWDHTFTAGGSAGQIGCSLIPSVRIASAPTCILATRAPTPSGPRDRWTRR